MTSEIASRLAPPPRILLGPGPSDVAPTVTQALAAPLVGHLDPAFLKIMNELQSMLRQVMRTNNPTTFAVSGTGMAGMECCLVNLLEPGDRIVVGVNGVFGGRMADMAQRIGAEVTTIEKPWGEVFTPDDLAPVLDKVRPKVLGIVHAETSTGAWQPAEELGKLCRERDALLLLDTVTSLAGVPVETDAWGVDAIYSGTQKCLSCPPGLAPVSFGPRAMEAIAKRKRKCQSWYLDVGMLSSYWGAERAYHHTAPIAMNYALHEALRLVLEEGLEARHDRHLLNHRALAAGLAAMGIEFAAAPGHRLPTLNAVRIPA
ncbi:MAG TPA: alanine--glyoxylate aminotransferase family protein, partial [Planctomycetia bacterium]|nr:alanine--glyoxylate aminotransferase family protein [Planctomycetia bacterium]